MGLRVGQQGGKSEICALAREEIVTLGFQVSAEDQASFFLDPYKHGKNMKATPKPCNTMKIKISLIKSSQ